MGSVKLIPKKRMNYIVARHVDVQAKLDRVARIAQLKARLILKEHYNEGDAVIEPVRKGKVDRYIILATPGGLAAARKIEFGRPGGNLDKNGNPVSPMAPVAPLQKAVGIL